MMAEFEKRLSLEDLSSLLVANSHFVTVPITTRRANSNSNLLDVCEERRRRSGGGGGNRVEHDHGVVGLEEGEENRGAKFSSKKRFHSMDDIFSSCVRTTRSQFPQHQIRQPKSKIMSDSIPSPESDSSYASSSASSAGSTPGSASTCEISLLERLIRTHPVWFLPALQRSGALHLLQGREVGNFIVRSSTQPKTMAISVKLPGNNVEHYLLKANANKISLENSSYVFDTVHQLIAHYCETSDEIPICLRIPNRIASALSRQQLTSIALLGQEFWSIGGSGSTKDNTSPEVDIDRTLAQGGVGSQSGSSRSLNDLTRRFCRPTTLDIGRTGGTPSISTPPPVPLRWSRSTLLTPTSQVSSMQSALSESGPLLSTEKSSRSAKKRKRSAGTTKTDSIHYKDTEILALDMFKGTKTLYDDKMSDYEDIWSPNYGERSNTPKLSTFKPDLIPSNLGEFENISNRGHSCSPNQNTANTPPEKTTRELVQNMNIQNHRLSSSGHNLNLVHRHKSNENISKSSFAIEHCTTRKSPGLYSEPVDSITSLKSGTSRDNESNMRWSQPALSLLKVDFSNPEASNEDSCSSRTGSGEGKPNSLESKLKIHRQEASTHRPLNAEPTTVIGDIGSDFGFENNQINCVPITHSSSSTKTERVPISDSASSTTANNLHNFRNNIKRVQGKFDDEQVPTPNPSTLSSIPVKGSYISAENPSQNSPRPNQVLVGSSHVKNSWNLDNSWELVMWQKDVEGQLKESTAKFPIIPSPPRTPRLRGKTATDESNNGAVTSTTFVNNNDDSEGYNSLRRFSCYDNLERSKAERNAAEDAESDSDEDKISPAWDSSKWEHLMRIISDSTQQLDLISSVGNNNANVNVAANVDPPRNTTGDHIRTEKVETRLDLSVTVVDVRGNAVKAGKEIAAVVRNLAGKDDGVFGPTLKSFISCTIAARVQDPYKVMRNVRQFISGMKNYLLGVNMESEELRREIKKQTEFLSSTEFLSIDDILESILVDLVIAPLHLHIRGLIDVYHAQHEEPIQLCEGSSQTEKDDPNTFKKLKNIYNGFEDAVSPMEKLDKWNEYVCCVQELDNYSTDSFLPQLSETLGSVCSPTFPSHVDYMIGLLPTSSEERNNYSLSLLQSSVSALKVKADQRKCSATSVRVLIPDERNGTLIKKMVPVRNSTTNKDVAKLLASKLGIVNPTDYALVTVKNGEETICPESELIYNCLDDNSGALAYKRIDAKIGWPQKMS